ncbi:hypothetical protein [Micromonospora sp. NPDC049799]|uniref:hypothetical protein n=1 Tax=Micromonospora sp. NPDC049799 TaxID=3154741 RepID=UPI0033F34B63
MLTEKSRKAKAAAAGVSTLATAPGTVSFAVVREDGTLARSSGGVTSLRFSVALYGPGQYQVSFPYNVSTKAFVATIGDAGPGYVPPGGEISVAPRTAPLTNSVFVQTRDSDGDPANRPFHLVIAN